MKCQNKNSYLFYKLICDSSLKVSVSLFFYWKKSVLVFNFCNKRFFKRNTDVSKNDVFFKLFNNILELTYWQGIIFKAVQMKHKLEKLEFVYLQSNKTIFVIFHLFSSSFNKISLPKFGEKNARELTEFVTKIVVLLYSKLFCYTVN